MEFRVLGPLEVRRDGRPVDLRGTKRRAVLALLVLQANEVVRTDRLIEQLWGDHQPANAPAALHNHVSRLRKDLGEDVVVTKPWGYVLRAPLEAIDLRRFESRVAEARPLPARERNAKLGEALGSGVAQHSSTLPTSRRSRLSARASTSYGNPCSSNRSTPGSSLATMPRSSPSWSG
jgi:DNA-binding SARP family transcriptional activator